MLLTISTTHLPATDLGYLLHKNPAHIQTEELSFGKACVFYPDASVDLCTAALLVEIDPVALVRGRGPAGEGGQLEQYVNDRPYAANSFLSVALGRIFSTAMSGRSKDRPELAETAIPLTAHLPVIAARGGEDLVKRLFEPLGYSVEMQGSQLDDKFPEWGASPYVALTIAGTVRLQDLLTHLYVLIPVLDNEKHYWVANDEIEKLLKRGEGWLGSHPEKDLIVSRYLKRQRSLTREALSRLLAEDTPSDEADELPTLESPASERAPSLHDQRLQTVMSVIRDTGTKRVVDLGCGEGKLLRLLLSEKQFESILGMDVSWRSLETAKERLRLERLSWVYGHTPVPEPLFLNNTVNIDTGCVFGGQLTALRYPERKIVSVKAHQTYYEPARPFLPGKTGIGRLLQHAQDDVLDLADVVGKRLIDTRLKPKITIREENAIAALEVMSRFASDPKWLIYLPPTMSPTETSKPENLLEHPDEAFAFYRKEGITTVVCEQKHMGSRAVVVLCKDEAVSQKRFGVVQASLGTVYTRTGRRFFTDEALEREFLSRLQIAVERSGLWDELATDWLCLDCELMPWSAKAQELLQKQYAPVGNAGVRALHAENELINQAMQRVFDLEALSGRTTARLDAVDHYIQAYRQYCWPVGSLGDLKLAPFHILASEGAVHTDKPHTWHMETIARLCAADSEILFATPFKVVDLQDEASTSGAVNWWAEMTAQGREGMVVKPMNFIAEGKRGITQPAMKCRGAEYLRIIYGPEYLLPENLERLRARNVGAKRSLASREFALGIEALERFVRKEPLRLTHECVFGVLALESEPVDPRL